MWPPPSAYSGAATAGPTMSPPNWAVVRNPYARLRFSVVVMSATKACAAGPNAAAPIPSSSRKRMNQYGSVVVVNSSSATVYTIAPATMTGLRPIMSLSQPSGDENSSVPT